MKWQTMFPDTCTFTVWLLFIRHGGVVDCDISVLQQLWLYSFFDGALHLLTPIAASGLGGGK